MNSKEKMYQAIDQHGQRLNNMFSTNLDNVALCKKLFRLENKANSLAESYCNGYIQYEEFDKESDNLLDKVASILGTDLDIYMINGDPRGYAFKFTQEFTNENIENMYRDFGGYGIVAPDFRTELA
tara:strand:+ start:32 stop:409 length:378 start_codon:yes stop_codon:yes gene_type:complete